MTRNIIFFGGTGEGKSSCINMLAGRNIADTSANATGCTFDNRMHNVTLNGEAYQLWDTAGLNEGEGGTVPHQEAIAMLYRLLKRLDNGISLLVFVMRAPRMKDSAQPNWTLFHEIICQQKVPIIAVVTGLELEENGMDNWWVRNRVHFEDKGMRTSGYACVTGVRGRRRPNGTHMFDPEYEESRTKLMKVITETCLLRPWKYTGVSWFKEVVEVSYRKAGGCSGGRERIESKKRIAGDAVVQLKNRCGMSQVEAEALGNTFARIDAGA